MNQELKLLLIVLGSFVALGSLVSPCEGQVLKQPGLPFEIHSFSLDMDRVTREVNFNFKLANHASDPLKEIVLAVLVKDTLGNPRAFQSSLQKVDVAPGTEKQFTLRLSNLLYVDPAEGPINFTAGIKGARTEGAAWMPLLSPLEFVTALKEGGFVPIRQAPVGAFQTAGCDRGFCIDCRATAECVCGKGCVKNFKCTIGEICSCEFTCTNDPLCKPFPCTQ